MVVSIIGDSSSGLHQGCLLVTPPQGSEELASALVVVGIVGSLNPMQHAKLTDYISNIIKFSRPPHPPKEETVKNQLFQDYHTLPIIKIVKNQLFKDHYTHPK